MTVLRLFKKGACVGLLTATRFVATLSARGSSASWSWSGPTMTRAYCIDLRCVVLRFSGNMGSMSTIS